MSALSAAHFHNEEAAFAELESLIWPSGAVCPHCGGKERIYTLQGVRSKPSKKNPEGGRAHRPQKVRPMPETVHGSRRHNFRG